MLFRWTSPGCLPCTSGSILTGLSVYPSAEKHAHRSLSPFTSTLCLLSRLTNVWVWALTTVTDQKEIRPEDYVTERRKDFPCLDESGLWVRFCQVTFILNADFQAEQRETENIKQYEMAKTIRQITKPVCFCIEALSMCGTICNRSWRMNPQTAAKKKKEINSRSRCPHDSVTNASFTHPTISGQQIQLLLRRYKKLNAMTQKWRLSQYITVPRKRMFIASISSLNKGYTKQI